VKVSIERVFSSLLLLVENICGLFIGKGGEGITEGITKERKGAREKRKVDSGESDRSESN